MNFNFQKSDFDELMAVRDSLEPCVSVYLPTPRPGNVQEDKIRLKNALAEAQRLLAEGTGTLGEGWKERQAAGFLTPAWDLLEDENFWSSRSDGLAVFVGKDFFRQHAVPFGFQPVVYVSSHFFLRPLIPLIAGDTQFFLLALSQGEVRLFEASQFEIGEVSLQELAPASIEEALEAEQPQKSMQWRGSAGGGGGRQAATHYGSASHKDQHDWQLEEYFRQVDAGLTEVLNGETAPLVIAAVDYLVPVFRKVTKYPNVADFHLGGNPQHEDAATLHQKAWAELEAFFDSERQQKSESFKAHSAQGKTSSVLREIVPAAVNGRVDTLFVDKDAPVVWGWYNEADNKATLNEEQKPYSACLINLAAVETLRNGGKVFHTDRLDFSHVMTPLHAVYRY